MSKRPVRRRKSRSSNKPNRANLPKELIEVSVHSLGAKGDGLAKDHQERDFFVPYSVEGDIAEIKVSAKRGETYVGDIQRLITPGPHRTEPPCPYYAKCGGCSLQHMDATAYADWKSERVGEALNRSGVEAKLEKPVLVPQGHRRRAAFAAVKKGKKIIFGFNARASHKLEEIENCLLLTQELNALIPAIRQLLPNIMKQEGQGDIIINYPGDAPDIVFSLPGRMDLKAHEHLMAFAEKHNIGRMSWQENGKGEPEIIAQRAAVTADFSGTAVELPASPFLQPSKVGEDALVGFALSCLDKEKKILDLYAGCGSFTFALATKGIVHAVESNPSALKALELSAGRAGIGGRITTETRDLTRQPLMGKELEKFDAILFDPPRAGAREQAVEIAKSNIPLVIAISCNPSTFARDAAALIEGGYTLEKVVPVDQFTWSAHVEVAAVFRK